MRRASVNGAIVAVFVALVAVLQSLDQAQQTNDTAGIGCGPPMAFALLPVALVGSMAGEWVWRLGQKVRTLRGSATRPDDSRNIPPPRSQGE